MTPGTSISYKKISSSLIVGQNKLDGLPLASFYWTFYYLRANPSLTPSMDRLLSLWTGSYPYTQILA